MQKKLYLLFFGVSLFLCTAFLVYQQQPVATTTADRPNVLVLVSDDHGIDALGCYGNPVIQTPHLDALAADGIRFNRAFCTTASCSASRSVILSGLYNHVNGQYGHAHSFHHFMSFDDFKSLPVQLEEAGYRTARIGKYHVAPESVYKFDVALPGNSRNGVEMANNSKKWLSLRTAEPFFLYFCSSDPHRGGGFAEELPHQPDRFGNKPPGEVYEGIKEVTYEPEEVIVPPFLPDNAPTRAELAQYYQSVTRMDQGFGAIIDFLKETGQYDNTLIIYISDNGVAFPGAKTNLYEPGMKLPCLVKLPNQQNAGKVTDAMINWTDLAPTILDFAEAEKDEQLQGYSFKPVLENPETSVRKQVEASHTFHEITMYYPMRVIHKGRYKLLWNIAHGLEYPFASDLWASKAWQSIADLPPSSKYGKRSKQAYLHRAEFELYDLENDPYEIHNLAENPAYAELLQQMKADLVAFQKETDDPWVYKWTYE